MVTVSVKHDTVHMYVHTNW